jgi:O-antigen ligase
MLGRGFYEYFAFNDESAYVFVQRIEDYAVVRRLRALGVLADPNGYAQYLLALVPMLFVKQDRRGVGLRWVFIVLVLCALVLGIVLAKSRGALLGLVVLVGLVIRDRFKLLASGAASVVLIGALAGLNFAGGRSISIGGGMDRLNLWSEGLGMFKRSPIWGGGWGSFPDNFQLTAHNSFLLAACELGIIGYFFWLAMILTVVWQLQGVIAEPLLVKGEGLELKHWARATLYSLYIFLLTSFFLSQTYDPLLFLLLGMGVSISTMAAAQCQKGSFMPQKNWAVWSLALCCGSLFLIYVLVRLRAV